MQRQLRIPNPGQIIFIILAFCFLSTSYGAKVSVESTGLIPVQGGQNIHEDVKLYIMTFDDLAMSANNNSDIVLLQGMSLVGVDDHDENDDDDNTYIYVSSFKGHHTSSSSDLDEGRLFLEASKETENLSGNGVVGFFRKTGAWQKTNEEVDNLMGTLSGTLEYNTLETSRDVNIELVGTHDGAAFTIKGESTLQVVSDVTSSMANWSADESSDYEFTFSSTVFTREEDSNVYQGYLVRNDNGDTDEENEDPIYEWKRRVGLLRLVDNNDSDGDGVPDLSDTGSETPLGIIETNSVKLGENLVWSNDLNTKVSIDPKSLWLYGENLGWFYVPDQNDPDKIRIYIPDDSVGWIMTNKDLSPYYLRETDGAQLYFEIIEGEVWYYDYSSEEWKQPVYNQ